MEIDTSFMQECDSVTTTDGKNLRDRCVQFLHHTTTKLSPTNQQNKITKTIKRKFEISKAQTLVFLIIHKKC